MNIVSGSNSIFVPFHPEEALEAIERGIASDEPLSASCGNRVTYSVNIKGDRFVIAKRYKHKQSFSRKLHGRVEQNGNGSLVTFRFALDPVIVFSLGPLIAVLLGVSILFILTGDAQKHPQPFAIVFGGAILLMMATPITRRSEEARLRKYLEGIIETHKERASTSRFR